MGSVRVRLSIMMFLEYAVWGVWAVNLSVYLGGLESFRENLGFKINMIFLTMAIANILAAVRGQPAGGSLLLDGALPRLQPSRRRRFSLLLLGVAACKATIASSG